MKKLVLFLFIIFSMSVLAEIVYITKTGKKYHASENCRGLSRAKSISKIDKAKAVQMGYTACKFEY